MNLLSGAAHYPWWELHFRRAKPGLVGDASSDSVEVHWGRPMSPDVDDAQVVVWALIAHQQAPSHVHPEEGGGVATVYSREADAGEVAVGGHVRHVVTNRHLSFPQK